MLSRSARAVRLRIPGLLAIAVGRTLTEEQPGLERRQDGIHVERSTPERSRRRNIAEDAELGVEDLSHARDARMSVERVEQGGAA